MSRALVCLTLLVAAPCAAVQPFTVPDEIGMTQFGNLSESAPSVHFSPDGKYVAAYAERGRLDLNEVEGSLRIYLAVDLRAFYSAKNAAQPPSPLWTVTRLSPESPAIGSPRWLRDASGIAFLEHGPAGTSRLLLADVNKKSITRLTPDGRSVKAFDVRDAAHYAYVLESEGLTERAAAEHRLPAVTVTGRPITDFIFAADRYPRRPDAWGRDRGDLQAVIAGQSQPVRSDDQRNVTLFVEGERNFALSPDGLSLITVLPVVEVPTAWETHYPPPRADYPYRVHAGKQDLDTFTGFGLVSEYVRIDLRTGAIESLADAPTGVGAGWFAAAGGRSTMVRGRRECLVTWDILEGR